ncbi:hypothetical protein BH23ACT11_BH23ACT11_20280 [soil metagenome]
MRYLGIAASLVLVLFSAGLAEAQTDGEAVAAEAEIVALEAEVQGQDAELSQQVQQIAEVGGDLQQTQTQVDGAVARTQELSQQTSGLEAALAAQQKSFANAKSGYEEQARSAYKGHNVAGLIGILDSVLSADNDSWTLTGAQIRNVLVRSQQRIEDYRATRLKLQNTLRQISAKRADYQGAMREERVQILKLRRKEARLEASVVRVREDRAQAGTRIRDLRAAERRRIYKTRPATGGPVDRRARELKIARNDIVARPVKPISKKHYRKLYGQSAKKYGFGKDWYILAAVGKVETNHGANMGPSSAGAMGPMQFMPSTWESSGVDGNGDGVANVMDPRDAIPAAAKYLKTGGAPKDWYAALYSYNHADWYVKKVLGVAEGYRRLAKDNRAGPYV